MPHLLLYLLHSVALLLAVLGAAIGYGALAMAPLRLPGLARGEGLLFAMGLGLGALSLLVLLLSALGLIYPAMILALLAVGVTLAALKRQLWRPLPAPRPATRPTGAPPQIALRLGLLLLIGLALVFGLFAHALAPPIDYDVVAYHFAIPKLYIEAHRLIYIPYILHSNWPLGTEMLFLIGLTLQSEAMAQLITWAFAVLLIAALIMFGERWLPPSTGWIAAAALCSMQMTTRLVGTGMIEVPLTCYTFLAFYALWHWHESQAWGWLVLSALLAGCAAATKLNGAAQAIIFAVAALTLLLLARRPAQAGRVFVVYGLASFLMVLPWYLKTWAFTGNPIWPFLYPVLGGANWDALGSTYLLDFLRGTNMEPTIANWATGLWQVTVADGRFGSFLLGPYLLALFPLGLLAAARRPDLRPLLMVLLLVTLAFYTLWFLMTHQTRFLIPAVPMGLLFGAAGLAWLLKSVPRPLSAALQAGLVAWLLAGAWVFNADHQHTWQRSRPYLLGEIDREAFLTSFYPDYPGFSYINQQVAPTARVLLAPFEARGYYLERPYMWTNPIGQRALRFEQLADVGQLRAELRRLGITHVLINTRYVFDTLAYWEHMDMLLTDLVTRHGQLLYESAQSRVYVLDSSEADVARDGEAAQP